MMLSMRVAYGFAAVAAVAFVMAVALEIHLRREAKRRARLATSTAAVARIRRALEPINPHGLDPEVEREFIRPASVNPPRAA